MPISSVVIIVDSHQRLNVWTLCLIQPLWNCITKRAILVIVYVTFCLLLVTSVLLIDLFYHSVTAFVTRNRLSAFVCLKNCKFYGFILNFCWSIHVCVLTSFDWCCCYGILWHCTAFAELQTDMSEIAGEISGAGGIPFRSYRSFCMSVPFQGAFPDFHSVIKGMTALSCI